MSRDAREDALDRLADASTSLLETVLKGERALTGAERETAKHAARVLHRDGVDLAMDRATEFSGRVGERFQLAAAMALVAYGPEAPEFARYARDAVDEEALRALEHALRSHRTTDRPG